MAGHKGYGISFMMDVLSGVLTGSSYGTDVTGPFVPTGAAAAGTWSWRCASTRCSIPGRVRSADRRPDRVHEGGPLAPGSTEIFYPGEIEDRAEAQGRRAGVLLPEKTVAELRVLGAECGVSLDPVEDGA